MIKKCLVATAAAIAMPAVAHAAPGAGDEVYGATVTSGEVELEARYGQLAGGPDDSEDALKLELAYAPSNRLRLAALAEFEKEPGRSREAEAMGFEAIYAIGRVGGIDIAIYGEYEVAFHDTDAVETKLLLQRKAGPFDARLNLIAAKPLRNGASVELGYAASVDYSLGDDVSVGVAGFGNLGTFNQFAPREEHFLGPVVKGEIEGLGPELEIEAGYLFALGKARDDTNGQLRLNIGMEF